MTTRSSLLSPEVAALDAPSILQNFAPMPRSTTKCPLTPKPNDPSIYVILPQHCHQNSFMSKTKSLHINNLLNTPVTYDNKDFSQTITNFKYPKLFLPASPSQFINIHFNSQTSTTSDIQISRRPSNNNHSDGAYSGSKKLQGSTSSPASCLWLPPSYLPIHIHWTINTAPLRNEILTLIKTMCQMVPAHHKLVSLARKPNVILTTTKLRNLIAHGEPVDNEILVLFLDILSSQNKSSYVDPSFSEALKNHGWQSVKYRFAIHRQRGICHPHLSDTRIAIPIFLNGNHWVAVCRQVVNGQIHFYYVDDMCNSVNERTVKHLLSNNQTDSEFLPPDSVWVSCKNIYYTPYSNECGPRSLLALAVMPYMHPNVAQEARCWVASSIIEGKVDLTIYPSTNVQPISTSSESHPHSLIDWCEDSLPIHKIGEISFPLNEKTPTQEQVQEVLCTSNLHQHQMEETSTGNVSTVHSSSDNSEDRNILDLTSPIFQPKKLLCRTQDSSSESKQEVPPLYSHSLLKELLKEEHTTTPPEHWHPSPAYRSQPDFTNPTAQDLARESTTVLNPVLSPSSTTNLPEILPCTDDERVQHSLPKPKTPSKSKLVQSSLLQHIVYITNQDTVDTTWVHTMEPIGYCGQTSTTLPNDN
jgi:hypothetical protein